MRRGDFVKFIGESDPDNPVPDTPGLITVLYDNPPSALVNFGQGSDRQINLVDLERILPERNEPEGGFYSGELYIWWVSQRDCERIGDGVMLRVIGVPDYLYSEFRSRLGRAGRCRLWTAPQFDLDEIEWDEAKAAALNLTDSHGGIVIAASELEICRKMPGTVTDVKLNHLPGTLLEED